MFKVTDHKALLQSGSASMEEMHRTGGHAMKNCKKRKCRYGLDFPVLGVGGWSWKA